MHIPKKYAVFDSPVYLDSKEVERLSPFLSGWKRLAPLLKLGVNEPDLERLITLELLGKQRWFILQRLLMRLGQVQRAALEKKIRRIIS